MADLPILFSAPMVRALISGTKTQTRRTFGKLRRFGPIHQFGISDTPGYAWHFRDSSGRFHDLRGGELLKYLPYKVGDRLYVREAWRAAIGYDGHSPAKSHKGKPVLPSFAIIAYEADPLPDGVGKLRQGMHMPKWASRITLIVEGVKVERLNDCSEEDARAEGAFWTQQGHEPAITARDDYRQIWEAINGHGAWDANPWVVAYTFRRIMGNIDLIPDVNSPEYISAQAGIAERLSDGS